MSYLRGIYRNLQMKGLRKGLRLSYSVGSELFLSWVGESWNYGKAPFEEEWDVLVLLDACRFDLFDEFVTNHQIYERLKRVDSRYSCASTSREWIKKVYAEAPDYKLLDIHLVSANGWEPRELDLSVFGGVTPVWEHHDPELGTVPPEVVTDAAINTGRTSECSRLVIHYMQPHAPFIHVSGKYNSVNKAPGEGKSQNVWEGLRQGEYDVDEVWADYGQNLLAVLDEVERLVDNIDGSVVITADHGNAIGEFGIYGHPSHVPLPSLKRVPWARLEAQDENTSEPDSPETPGISDADVEDHLRNLGYVP